MSKFRKVRVLRNSSIKQDKTPEPSPLLDWLGDNGVKYTLVSHDQLSRIPDFARGLLFKDEKGYILAIFHSDYVLNYPALCTCLFRDLEYVDQNDSKFKSYYDEVLSSYPAIPKVLDVSAIADKSIQPLLENETILFATGHDAFLQLQTKDMGRLLSDVVYKNFTGLDTISELFAKNTKHSSSELDKEKVVAIGNNFSINRMKSRIDDTFEIPILPPMADKLLQLRVDPTAEATQLARLVEKDPSLAAQMISWACSPYYGYPGKITSIDDAIIKVLGYDLVMNIALGIAIGQVMHIPIHGPLGLKNYWTHSIYAATLIEKLLLRMPTEVRPFRGLGYLCGLLHNFGHLLLGQLFPPQFFNLNQMIYANPNVPVLNLEEELFKTNHQELGRWLMESWHMPQELITTVAHHHDPDYSDEHANYVNLTFLANVLLARENIGDELRCDIPERLLEKLGLTDEIIAEVVIDFKDSIPDLEEFIKLLVK